jgi:geranylgeranyl pyrophosphate synthase
MEPRRRQINHALEQYLSTSGRRPTALHEAMQYAVLGDGKRVRPEGKVGDLETLELIHTGLPRSHNDSYRAS